MTLPSSEDLRLFLAIADKQSFTAAGRAAGLSPPAVSRAVARLEAELDVQLFVRTTRQVSLTAAGARFAEAVAPVVSALEQAVSDLRGGTGELRGKLRISVPLSFGGLVLPSVLARFRTAFPGVDLELTMTDELVNLMEAPVDMAVRISGPPSGVSTIWRKICQVERVLVTSPDGPEAATANPADIPPPRRLGYGQGPGGETWTVSRNGDVRRIRAGESFLS